MRIGIVLSNELLNLGNQFLDALERTTANGSLGDDVEPGSVGGCVVNLITRVGSQPPLDSRMLVGSIVIYDQMDCSIVKSVLYLGKKRGHSWKLVQPRYQI